MTLIAILYSSYSLTYPQNRDSEKIRSYPKYGKFYVAHIKQMSCILDILKRER